MTRLGAADLADLGVMFTEMAGWAKELRQRSEGGPVGYSAAWLDGYLAAASAAKTAVDLKLAR